MNALYLIISEMALYMYDYHTHAIFLCSASKQRVIILKVSFTYLVINLIISEKQNKI